MLRYRSPTQADRYRRLLPWGASWESPAAMVAGLGSALLHYWEPLEQDSITQSGGLVSAYEDIKGGLTLAQATEAARPGYTPGADMLEFDGADDFIRVDSVGSLPTGANGGVFLFLVRQDAAGSSIGIRQIFSYGAILGVNNNNIQIRRSTVSGVNRFSASVGTGAASVAVNDASVDFSGRHVVEFRLTPSGFRYSLDGGRKSVHSAVVPGTATERTCLGGSTIAVANQLWGGGIGSVMSLALDTPTHLVNAALHTLLHRRAA